MRADIERHYWQLAFKELGEILSYTHSNAEQYIKLIREHVIEPLEETPLSSSCYATCMMIFSCIDGLGKLLHSDDKARAGVRFKYFLTEWMKGRYGELASELYELRNSLLHNGIAPTAYMSMTEESRHEEIDYDNGFLYINTKRFVKDFQTALAEVEFALQSNICVFENANARLLQVAIENSNASNRLWKTTAPSDTKFKL